MATSLEALDQLFGTIDELTSEYQKSPTSIFSYDGDVIQEPPKYPDRTRIMNDLLLKTLLILPGTKITDTEFLSSGYATLLLPNAGPYKGVELRIQPRFSTEKHYEFFVHWEGFSHLVYTHSVLEIKKADVLLLYLSGYLGTLWRRCYEGLCIYEGWKPFTGYFDEHTCGDIGSSTISSSRTWHDAIRYILEDTPSYTIHYPCTSLSPPSRSFLGHMFKAQSQYNVNDPVILQTPSGPQEAIVTKIQNPQERKPYKFRYQVKITDTQKVFTVPAGPTSSAIYYILGTKLNALPTED